MPARLLIALQSQYSGHLSRGLVYCDLLAPHFDLHIVTVGRKPAAWFEPALRRLLPHVTLQSIPGPYMVEDRRGGVSFTRTTLRYLADLSKHGRRMRDVRAILDGVHPDVVLSDFEAFVSGEALRRKLPLITIDGHRRFLLHDCPRPHVGLSRLRIYAGFRLAMALMHRRGGLDLALSLLPGLERARGEAVILPPLLRREVYDTRAQDGDYLLIYHNSGGMRDEILRQCGDDLPAIVYGYHRDETVGRVRFKQSDAQEFLQDLAGCRAYASRAGFESVAEALYFGKPCYLVPQPGQFEQLLNAQHAAQLGAVTANRFDYRAAYENQQQPNVDREWMRTAREMFVDEVLKFAEMQSDP